jgi:hypothetical protein
MAGGLELEAQLHRRFQAFHIVGEWFHFTKELADFVKKHSAVKYALSIIVYGPPEVLSETPLKHEPACPVRLTWEQAETYSSLPPVYSHV